jgi:PTS system mannose-specific IIA component
VIGILIFTHGELGSILKVEAERLTGEQQLIQCARLNTEESLETVTARIQVQIKNLDEGNGVLVLVDVVGGTPWNIAGKLQRHTPQHKIRRIGGGGLPLFIKAFQEYKNITDLDEWVTSLVAYNLSRMKAH